jgi:hypothetical protein
LVKKLAGMVNAIKHKKAKKSLAGDIQQLWRGYKKKRHSTLVLDCLGGVKVLRNDEDGETNAASIVQT